MGDISGRGPAHVRLPCQVHRLVTVSTPGRPSYGADGAHSFPIFDALVFLNLENEVKGGEDTARKTNFKLFSSVYMRIRFPFTDKCDSRI